MKLTTGLTGFAGGLALVWANSLVAQDSVFEPGWTLQTDISKIEFQSLNNDAVLETSSFAKFSGAIDADGNAQVEILLDSVDTNVDLRNVRLRFIFFEAFKHPKAVASLDLNEIDMSRLEEEREMTIALPFTLALHGFEASMSAKVEVELTSDDQVRVHSAAPVLIAVSDFGLDENLAKLEKAARATILPRTAVDFDLTFNRLAASDAATVLASVDDANPERSAVEEEGEFSTQACVDRFDTLSRTGNIYFETGSAELTADSAPLLRSVVGIVSRCSELVVQISGHTDDVGAAEFNQTLSERRAAAVAAYLRDNGVEGLRLLSVGYGEDRPVASNDTQSGRGENRRIEFSVYKGQ